MTSYSLAALDMAGTTVDEGGLVYRVLSDSVGDAIGAPVPVDVLHRWKGTSKEEAIEGILRDLGEDASRSRVEEVFGVFRERLDAAYREQPARPIPGVLETFETLRSAGVKVVLQTGYSADVAAALLSGLEWRVGETVDALITSDMVALSRPAPYLVFRAMEETGVTDVRRVLTAGDTPNDLGMGTNAGAGFVCGVLTGSFSREQLAKEPHTHILDSVAELPNLL